MQRRINVLLSLGSNHGDRQANLKAGLERLSQSGFSIRRISPALESPALLPPNSPANWNRPFLNLITIGETEKDYDSFLIDTKAIQTEIGKPSDSKWSPRNLDIDIVTWDQQQLPPMTGRGVMPIFKRPYVLSPLVHIAPEWPVSSDGRVTAFEFSTTPEVDMHIPLWMGIVNVTPDSFSDGGRYSDLEDVATAVNRMIRNGVHIIDIGAESTRPNAKPLTDDEEWQRLQPVLKRVQEICADQPLAPQISVDTYHPATAEKALNFGVDIVNDVSGLRNGEMMALARDSGKTFIAMHSVTVPVDPKISIGDRDDAGELFAGWIDEGRRIWEANGLELDNIIVDPGIGFGKSSLQSLELMRSIQRLRARGHRILIGHSRKRFLKSFSNYESPELDFETMGASLNLCAQSVDILRVHDVEAHTRAYLSWAHLLSNRATDSNK